MKFSEIHFELVHIMPTIFLDDKNDRKMKTINNFS